MSTQQVFRIHKDDNGHRAGIETIPVPEPADGEVLVRVSHSGVNYKDALAGTGKGQVVKRFPITGGVDAAGIVEQSRHDGFKPGDGVIATGWGLGFDHDGGYAEYLCVPAKWLVPMPDQLDPRGSMILATAGFTAALAVHRMLVNGQTSDMGPILVTGATGGVGCIAISILSRLGFDVAAVSGKADLHDWLRGLGAGQIVGRNELPGGERPLEKAVWGGAVDNVGGAMLAKITRTVVPNGNIASIGLAGGIALETTVMPFILRGVGLLGCNSVDVPYPLRSELWRLLASEWRPNDLDQILSATVDMQALPEVFERMLAGRTHGRILVETSAQG
ncbi:MAG: YhdH/YhfP family quinone oxidoreductase [Thiohalocapsa sp.]